MRETLLALALDLNISLRAQQEFRVQVAAFTDTLASNYFLDRGLTGVYDNTDQHGIHRFFLGTYRTREQAEKVQRTLLDKGFPNAQIIDLEEERALCGTPCPYFSKTTIYASDSTTKDAVKCIFFEFGRASLSTESMKVLDEVFLKMKQNPNLHLSILGHADAVGTPEQNLAISIRRAKSVRNELINRGLAFDHIKVKVFGEAMPVSVNEDQFGKDSPQGRKYNRRVVLVLTDPSGEITNEIIDIDHNVPDDFKFRH